MWKLIKSVSMRSKKKWERRYKAKDDGKGWL